jgi:hypothetical protein
VGIGASVFLLAIGAIIAFALHVQVGWLDLSIVGWVLMIAGAVGLLVTLSIFNRRRRTIVSSTPPAGYPAQPPAVYPGEQRIIEDDPAPYDRRP